MILFLLIKYYHFFLLFRTSNLIESECNQTILYFTTIPFIFVIYILSCLLYALSHFSQEVSSYNHDLIIFLFYPVFYCLTLQLDLIESECNQTVLYFITIHYVFLLITYCPICYSITLELALIESEYNLFVLYCVTILISYILSCFWLSYTWI